MPSAVTRAGSDRSQQPFKTTEEREEEEEEPAGCSCRPQTTFFTFKEKTKQNKKVLKNLSIGGAVLRLQLNRTVRKCEVVKIEQDVKCEIEQEFQESPV